MGAVIAGGVGFLSGFVGPILLSAGNLAPLWGILVTGPIGALAGALWGAIRWVTDDPSATVGRALPWVIGIWLASLAYTLFALTRFGPNVAWWALGLQLFALAAAVTLLWGRRTSRGRGAPDGTVRDPGEEG